MLGVARGKLRHTEPRRPVRLAAADALQLPFGDRAFAVELVKLMEAVGLRRVTYRRLGLGTVTVHTGIA
jgi:ubiquinone/menaquinone biosynthesis C-methylase UbiE